MTRIELLGRGGESVDFARTVLSHGVADLPPNAVAQDGTALDTVLLIDGEARPVRVVADGPGFARIDTAAAEPVIRHMLRLDEDFSPFYLVAAADPALEWAAAGAGRMLRSPTVFEDLVKTICTTNCTWSATVRHGHRAGRRPGDAGTRGAGATGVPDPGGDGRSRGQLLHRRRQSRVSRPVPADDRC